MVIRKNSISSFISEFLNFFDILICCTRTCRWFYMPPAFIVPMNEHLLDQPPNFLVKFGPAIQKIVIPVNKHTLWKWYFVNKHLPDILKGKYFSFHSNLQPSQILLILVKVDGSLFLLLPFVACYSCGRKLEWKLMWRIIGCC